MNCINGTASTPYSATGPAAGYIYQCRIALLLLLARFQDNPQVSVWIEGLDDVQFDEDCSPIEAIQVKHSIAKTGSLIDSSSDFWKTIRVWCHLQHERDEWAHIEDLLLITTATAPENSIASRLRSEDRDVDMAIQSMILTASTNDHQGNAEIYKTFLNLSAELQRDLVSRIQVFDQSPNVYDLTAKIIGALSLAAPATHEATFANLVEGWWMQKVSAQLTGDGGRIFGSDLHARMSEFRDVFRPENLPIFDDIMNAPDSPADEDRVFIRQLRLVGIHNASITRASREFYRAFEQRSRWIRKNLLADHHWDDYERRLREEWEIRFQRILADITASTTAQQKEEAGRKLVRWLEEEAQESLRAGIFDRSICRGSYHMLSDRKEVGWHPEYPELLGGDA